MAGPFFPGVDHGVVVTLTRRKKFVLAAIAMGTVQVSASLSLETGAPAGPGSLSPATARALSAMRV